tara:strand:- start:807 stop:947 length:141 start_codon:yes stop_codon:yes gene_type:complete
VNKLLALFFSTFLSLVSLTAQNNGTAIQEINQVMMQQEADWNKGDI